jgi:hypothetical protein
MLDKYGANPQNGLSTPAKRRVLMSVFVEGSPE